MTKVLDGRASLVELKVHGPTITLEGLSLRLYNPQSRQWSLNYANIASGVLTAPLSASSKMAAANFMTRTALHKVKTCGCGFAAGCEARLSLAGGAEERRG